VKLLSIYFAGIAGSTGLIAAYYWYRASEDPTWKTLNLAAKRNRMAAIWTAISVAASGISTLFGTAG
jgi:hypothetical protein